MTTEAAPRATGVVLMTYGAPGGRADVATYLSRIRGGTAPSDDLVAEMTRRYERIGWSPLVRITVAQAQALEVELDRGDGAGRATAPGRSWRVRAGMRFSRPTIAEAAETLVGAGVERIVGLVLSPQWSATIMGGYERALEDAVSMLKRPVRLMTAHEWYREPEFIEAMAERVREALGRLDRADDVSVVMTAHSLPKRVFDAEPGYVAQLRETAELVTERVGLAPDRWRWAYQSAGHTAEEWLRPDLKELFPSLSAAGYRDVLVVPVQFLSDHLEVLYDLDVAAAAEAASVGLRYHRAEMLNTDRGFIAALAAVVERTAALAHAAA